MQPTDDSELLRQYAENHSDEAFDGLVTRYVNMVYSVALRRLGNPHQAEELTQAVFIILAKKAPRLRHNNALSSWLFQVTRLTANNFLKSEIRRQSREQEAYMRSISDESGADIWQQIAPLLDDAVEGLGEKDRRAVVLRFYEGRNLREVGEALGASPSAAEKRVERAVEKLRRFFKKQGIAVPATVLAATISGNAVQAAPVALAKTAASMAIVKGATASASTLTLIKGALKIMAWTTAKTALVTVVVVGMATVSVVQHQAQVKLREQNEALQKQIAHLQTDNEALSVKRKAPHLPAPQMHVSPASSLPKENTDQPSLYSRLKDKQLTLTSEQAESYLKANGRSAANLLAAFRTSGSTALLKEAMQQYPNDPQVAFEAAFNKDLSPDEQRQWLDAFVKAAPGNALANYLSAFNYFNSGQTGHAVEELIAASDKPLQDYTLDRYQTDTEAYLAAGYSEADAKAAASMQLMLPQLKQLKQLGINILDLANAYRQGGDQASALAALQMAANIGQHYANSSPGEPLVSQLVGIAVMRTALEAMDPNSPYGSNGQTVQDQLNQLAQQRAALQELANQFSSLQQTMSDQEWITYKDRWMAFGEVAAEQWAVSKHGAQ